MVASATLPPHSNGRRLRKLVRERGKRGVAARPLAAGARGRQDLDSGSGRSRAAPRRRHFARQKKKDFVLSLCEFSGARRGKTTHAHPRLRALCAYGADDDSRAARRTKLLFDLSVWFGLGNRRPHGSYRPAWLDLSLTPNLLTGASTAAAVVSLERARLVSASGRHLWENPSRLELLDSRRLPVFSFPARARPRLPRTLLNRITGITRSGRSF